MEIGCQGVREWQKIGNHRAGRSTVRKPGRATRLFSSVKRPDGGHPAFCSVRAGVPLRVWSRPLTQSGSGNLSRQLASSVIWLVGYCVDVMTPLETVRNPGHPPTLKFSTPCNSMVGGAVDTCKASFLSHPPRLYVTYGNTIKPNNAQCNTHCQLLAIKQIKQPLGSCDRASWAKCEERENQQDATIRCLLSTLSQHVSGIVMPILRRTKTVCYCIWCPALRCKMRALLASYNAAPHNRYQPHPAEPAQHTTCSNTRSLFSWRWV